MRGPLTILRHMRLILPCTLLIALSFSGCHSTEPSPPSESPKPKPAVPSTKGSDLLRTSNQPPPGASTSRTNSAPVALPASGRIHKIHTALQFVVVDYTLGSMPPLDSIVGVFRGDQKVGQIRLTGPERNGFVAADVVDGILQLDDEVRTVPSSP